MSSIRYRLASRISITRTGLDLAFETPDGTALKTRASDELVANDLAGLKQGVKAEHLQCAGKPASVAAFFYTVERLTHSGLIEHVWSRDQTDFIILRPLDNSFVVRETQPPDTAVLCPHAYLSPDPEGWILRTARSANEAVLMNDSPLAWIGDLRRQTVTSDPVRDLKELLWQYGFLEIPAPEKLSYACWEFHDLLFHHATRHVGYGQRAGGTYRFRGRFPPVPATKPPMSPDFTELPAPGTADEERRTLNEVMSQRRSCRRHDDANPITLDQLSSFLHYCVRSEAFRHVGEQQLLRRPIPAGGAIHELEFYLAVRLCEGLDPGLYHYHGMKHRVYLVASGDAAGLFVEHAAAAWGDPGSQPQIVVIGASRLPRLAWKYERIAYRLSLLNAGVALQTMYLVATNLGLGGVALGAGDSSRFAQVTGLDPTEETSVVEFALGSPGA